jgi:hypothetical protein
MMSGTRRIRIVDNIFPIVTSTGFDLQVLDVDFTQSIWNGVSFVILKF